MEVEIEETLSKEPVQEEISYHDREYFMAIALLAAQQSKDPDCKVGACIVNKEKKIVGIGYNDMPRGCSGDEFPWKREKDAQSVLESKVLYVCHSEMNAIINTNGANVKNCTIYTSLFPCNECAKIIIQSGITEVVYLSNEKGYKPKYVASKKMLEAANVKYREFKPKVKQIKINFY